MIVTKDEVRVHGAELAERVKQILHEGNVRRMIVRNSGGHRVMDIPVAMAVVAFVAAPIVTAASAVAALASEWSIEIEREEGPDGGTPPAPSATDGREPEARGPSPEG